MSAVAEKLLRKLIEVCASGGVFVLPGALKSARDDFSLKTKKELLEFIANGGLERLEFVNSREWENSHIPGRIAHAYQFY